MLILKHCHYSLALPKLIFSKHILLEKNVTFTDSCKYEISEKSCVNKLFGVSHTLSPHKESDRFGWSYNKELNIINIYSYIYTKGALIKKLITKVNLNEENKFKLEVINNDDSRTTLLYINDELKYVLKSAKVKNIHYTLTPYFGGNSVAPHNIKINFKY